MMKSKKKENKQIEQGNQEEKKSSTKKIVSIFIGLDILLVIIVVLLLCLKGCKTPVEQPTEPEIDMVRVNKITDVFRDIVKKNIAYVGYDDDELDKVMAITYQDNYPDNFSLKLAISSSTKVYYSEVTSYPYDGKKEEYNDFVSYLLLDTTSYRASNAHIELNFTSITDLRVNTSKAVNRYVISESNSEPKDYYLNGFYKENDEFYVYIDALIGIDTDPFASPSNQVLKDDSSLYDYYKGLLIA